MRPQSRMDFTRTAGLELRKHGLSGFLIIVATMAGTIGLTTLVYASPLPELGQQVVQHQKAQNIAQYIAATKTESQRLAQVEDRMVLPEVLPQLGPEYTVAPTSLEPGSA